MSDDNQNSSRTFYRFSGNCAKREKPVKCILTQRKKGTFSTVHENRCCHQCVCVVFYTPQRKIRAHFISGDRSIKKGSFFSHCLMCAWYVIGYLLLVCCCCVCCCFSSVLWRSLLFIPQFNTWKWSNLHLLLWGFTCWGLCVCECVWVCVNCGKFAIYIIMIWAELFTWRTFILFYSSWMLSLQLPVTGCCCCYSCCYFWSTNFQAIPSHLAQSLIQKKNNNKHFRVAYVTNLTLGINNNAWANSVEINKQQQ